MDLDREAAYLSAKQWAALQELLVYLQEIGALANIRALVELLSHAQEKAILDLEAFFAEIKKRLHAEDQSQLAEAIDLLPRDIPEDKDYSLVTLFGDIVAHNWQQYDDAPAIPEIIQRILFEQALQTIEQFATKQPELAQKMQTVVEQLGQPHPQPEKFTADLHSLIHPLPSPKPQVKQAPQPHSHFLQFLHAIEYVVARQHAYHQAQRRVERLLARSEVQHALRIKAFISSAENGLFNLVMPMRDGLRRAARGHDARIEYVTA